ncbi:hypothetical protein AHAS_Ahas03G0304200 [Arachis hypogaea]
MSRCNKINFGDKNTRNLHQKANRIRKRNKVTALKDEEGNWIDDVADLKKWGVNFFKALYSSDGNNKPYPIKNRFPKLHKEDYAELAKEASRKEVKNAIFNMGSWKAPGSDEIPAKFFQHSWDIVAESLTSWVKDIFQDPRNIREVNQMLITIIPKNPAPKNFSHFRPISLCNVCYKVITKIVASRLKNFIPTLIANTQSSFVPGRVSADNILVVQEVVHTMRSRNQCKGLMAIKIDLEKAYDRLNWNFVVDTLKDMESQITLSTLLLIAFHPEL